MTFISISWAGEAEGLFPELLLRNPCVGCRLLFPDTKITFPKGVNLDVTSSQHHWSWKEHQEVSWPTSCSKMGGVRWDQSAQSFIWDLEDLQKSSLFHCCLPAKPFPYTHISTCHALIHAHGFSSSTEEPGAWLHLPTVPKCSVLKLSKEENAAILT